jgi:hypothetical protein
MLEAYIAVELSGSSEEAARRHAKAALALGADLAHRRTATLRDAALCVEATTSVVNIVAILAERSTHRQGEPVVDLLMRRELRGLSDAARELLVEAAADDHGVIICSNTLGGSYVKTNGKVFTQRGDVRSEARARGAVKELTAGDLIEDRDGKGEVFFVTDAGYRLADRSSATDGES